MSAKVNEHTKRQCNAGSKADSLARQSGAIAMTGDSISAWGDESMRQNANPQMYLMCATVFGDNVDEGLENLRRAKPPAMRKLHWRDLPLVVICGFWR